jgi:hypothetical protein
VQHYMLMMGRVMKSNKEDLPISAMNYEVEDEKSHENNKEELSFSVIIQKKEDAKSSKRKKLSFSAMHHGEEDDEKSIPENNKNMSCHFLL